MKKLVYLFVTVFALSFVSCGQATVAADAVDSTDTTVVDTVNVDSVADTVVVDTVK